MQAQQNQDQGWQQISIDRAHADLTLDFNFVDDWSEYQIVRTIIQEFIGAQSHIGYYTSEIHDVAPMLPSFDNFKTVYDSSMYQSDYNIIRVCQQGETTFISFRHSIKPSIFYRVCV
tara:strand:+ start:2455 stop:2805 length:351 start_codon:yes stop_codon:yes gene_type:complete